MRFSKQSMDLADALGVDTKNPRYSEAKGSKSMCGWRCLRRAVAPINNGSPHSELALTHDFKSATAEITNVSTVLRKGKLARIKGELRSLS